MKFIYNDSRRKYLRKELRNNATPAEVKLWQRLKSSQLNGCKFWRQYGVDRYVLDFYCPKIRLAIELDGSQHAKQVEYDQERTDYLQLRNITVLRFSNNEIIDNIDGVLFFLSDFTKPLLK